MFKYKTAKILCETSIQEADNDVSTPKRTSKRQTTTNHHKTSNQATDTEDSTLYQASKRQDDKIIMEDDSKRQEDDISHFHAHCASCNNSRRWQKLQEITTIP
jgi:hypothetical protein